MFSFKRSLIALVGVLVVVVALAAMMPLVSRGQGGNPFNRDTRKSYYLTQTTHNGSQPLTACAAGYHMASLWEIFDTSNLKYDTALGAVSNDSGSGPPTVVIVAGHILNAGWIRTGGAVPAGATRARRTARVGLLIPRGLAGQSLALRGFGVPHPP
jgi:hypothetical protein